VSEQSWKVPVTPAQRWALFNLAHTKSVNVKGQEGRVLRRFMRAFGLTELRAVLITEQIVNSELMRDDTTPSLFSLTAENRDYALKLDKEVERHTSSEMLLGDLFDKLEQLRADWKAPEGVPDFDATKEDWTPQPEERRDLIDDIADRVNALSTEQLRSVFAGLPEAEKQPAEEPPP